MGQLNPHIEKVMRHILNGEFEAADNYVRESLTAAVDAARVRLDQAMQEESAAKNIIHLSRPTAEPSDLNQPLINQPQYLFGQQGGDALAPDRRASILNAADEVAPNIGDIASTESVLKALAAKGVPLSGARPGTSVGNVLHKDQRWLRVSEGVFKRTA